MAEIVAAILQWLVPALVVFVITALALTITVWAVRRAHRSPKARAEADRLRSAAGITLVRLDDAVDELDLEVGLSGALYGGDAPTSLRRARLNAQRVRDEEFARFEDCSAADMHPREIRRAAALIEKNAAGALALIAKARTEHADWMTANLSAAQQVAATRQRLDELRATIGDPKALVAEMSARFEPDEWQPAADAARGALAALEDAEAHVTEAEERASDPSRTALPELAAAERSIRTAQADARTLEEAHRLAMQASLALPDELTAARTAIRQGLVTREHLDEDASERLGVELRSCADELDKIEVDAARRPTHAVDRIARVRDRLDLALSDAQTAQQRIRNARTALPGTLASARNAIAHAEAAVGHGRVDADARSRLIAAQAALASARQLADPVEALDTARRARLLAEDAQALANYAGMHTPRRP
ncbi:hypothetical protein [Microbacterium sp. C7(2022)]|uniref:hypothetical protein n=1 Tax=Microbacterium sp. C7(2022) TaxID=2992759 RepID=UPI00237C0758|nr:hypothetical protein [Microbacterium sp. C7(2022)]MDE0547579.1 hypothetical protein [Microbacterium sp. C7(2022)]